MKRLIGNQLPLKTVLYQKVCNHQGEIRKTAKIKLPFKNQRDQNNQSIWIKFLSCL